MTDGTPDTSSDESDRRPRPPERRRTAPTDADKSDGRSGFHRLTDAVFGVVLDVWKTALIVVLVGSLLLGVSGTWPPLVAVESGSMEPNIRQGDLVFIVEQDRFVSDGFVADTGITTYETGSAADYEKFGTAGDVIVFVPNGDSTETPVIHRAYYWVEAGENWVDTRAESAHLNGHSCEDVPSCPAPHDGFITKGDANSGYDQIDGAGAETTVIRPDWVVGKAVFRIPWLGTIRLMFDAVLGASAAVLLLGAGET